jgi:hypothetical protein
MYDTSINVHKHRHATYHRSTQSSTIDIRTHAHKYAHANTQAKQKKARVSSSKKEMSREERSCCALTFCSNRKIWFCVQGEVNALEPRKSQNGVSESSCCVHVFCIRVTHGVAARMQYALFMRVSECVGAAYDRLGHYFLPLGRHGEFMEAEGRVGSEQRGTQGVKNFSFHRAITACL